MLHAVLFLVLAGKLMLLYARVHVILHSGGDHYAVLRASLHGLRIYIVAFLLILHQPAFTTETGEILNSFIIHTRIMLIRAFRKIYLRLDDVIQRPRISLGSARASSELSTSYGREATSVTISRGGRMPLKGLILAMVLIF